MECLVIIIIGIVVYLLYYKKSQTDLIEYKHKKTKDIKTGFTTQTTVIHKEPCAYLDIETTGLDPYNGDLTVIGLYIEDSEGHRVVQLVGDEIYSSKLIDMIKNAKVIYTYNGKRFDLPYIKAKLNLDLTKYCIHKDLMYECWQRNLYGGFKEVEKKLGIRRKLTGIDGKEAVNLWYNYKLYDDESSLKSLLEYNKEDVLNLKVLRQKLNI